MLDDVSRQVAGIESFISKAAQKLIASSGECGLDATVLSALPPFQEFLVKPLIFL
jgi:hypothetical protein